MMCTNDCLQSARLVRESVCQNSMPCDALMSANRAGTSGEAYMEDTPHITDARCKPGTYAMASAMQPDATHIVQTNAPYR